MTTRERPKRADKNGASIVPPIISPYVPPPIPLTARHATRHGITEPPHATTRRLASHTATHIATPCYTASNPSTTHRLPATPPRPATRHAATRHDRRDEHE